VKHLHRYLGCHFSRLERLGKWSFLWRSWLEAVVIAYVIGEVLQGFFPAGPRTDLQGLPLVQLVALVAVIGPLFETVAFQCLPLELTAALGLRRAARLIISIVPFALMHQFAGVPTVVAAGVVGGFYFAFTYERWRRESLMAGVLMTFLLHSSYNLVGVLGMLFLHK
jgi:hypothetical protein